MLAVETTDILLVDLTACQLHYPVTKEKGGALPNTALPSLRYTPLFPLGFVHSFHCVVQVFMCLDDAIALGLLLRRKQRTNPRDRSIHHRLGLRPRLPMDRR